MQRSVRRDPFRARLDVPVAGGALRVARAGPPPNAADCVVLAAHGVTASLMTWLSVVRALDSRISFLAPDLRGRGRSATLPGPYGMAAHVADLVAVLDHVQARRAVLVGHSMGAFIVARLAAEHPARAAGLVLLDAGLPLPPPDDPDDSLVSAVGSAVMRLAITFPSADQYVEGWRVHPAFAHSWDDDLEAYARYDLVDNGSYARCVASAAAVRADSEEMVLDDTTRSALDRVRAPVRLLRAERGLFDDDPLIPAGDLRAFAESHPQAVVEAVPHVNHYTLVMGSGPGPHRVVNAIEESWRAAHGGAPTARAARASI